MPSQGEQSADAGLQAMEGSASQINAAEFQQLVVQKVSKSTIWY